MSGDRWITRLIAITVCVLATSVTMTACYLFTQEIAVPDPLDRLVTFLLGGLVGRLTASSTKEPQDVQVVNMPEDPVPVAPDLADAPEPPPARRARG